MRLKTISALFKDQHSAQLAIDQLSANGFNRSSISTITAENNFEKKTVEIEDNSRAPQGIAIEAAAGATIAGLTTVGAIVTTGGVALRAAGPMIAAFAGAGTGATAGGLIGGLVDLGMPEIEAKDVDESLGKGHFLVGVSVEPKDKSRVQELLKSNNPERLTIH